MVDGMFESNPLEGMPWPDVLPEDASEPEDLASLVTQDIVPLLADVTRVAR